ncbi:MAG: tRNA (adenosine(37)-N6)-dimethylallyltransferase MiaA [Fimbriimonadaceae bacterium]
MNASRCLLAIYGPTGSGKTALAEALADELEAVLLNSDNFQVYRGLDIGTAKPTDRHRYRLLDLCEPTEQFGLGEWLRLAAEELNQLYAEQRNVVIVGGSGLNMRALLNGYGELHAPPEPALREELNDQLEASGLEALVERLTTLDPIAADRTDLSNPLRVTRAIERLLSPPLEPVSQPYTNTLKLGIKMDPEINRQRIGQRYFEMLEEGWLEEVQRIKRSGVPFDAPGLKAHGYRKLWNCEESVPSEVSESIITEIQQYSKRQRTWMRKEPELNWVEHSNDDDAMRRHALALL